MEPNNSSNFNVVTPGKSSKSSKKGLIIGAIVVLFLAISIPAGVYLVKQQQDIKEKAQEALVCPAAEACPVAGDPTLLKSCYSVVVGASPEEYSCSTIANVGTTVLCGSTSYCCPSLGASWTTNLTLCAVPTPTPTPTDSATATPTATASPTATATATAISTTTPSVSPTATSASPVSTSSVSATANATATATTAPIPVTGVNWPTLIGTGLGILVIIGSILLVI